MSKIKITIDAPLLDCRQTVAESVLISWWAEFAAYAWHWVTG